MWSQLQLIQEEISTDQELQRVILDLQRDPMSRPGFKLQKGVLLYKDRLVLAAALEVIPDILAEFHSPLTGGHSGFLRTYKHIAMNVYWIGMKE